MFVYFMFVFKQKTVYELRISDWSSDVCSSDLHGRLQGIELSVPGIELHPHAVKMHRMAHHCLVDELEPHPRAVMEADRLGCREFLAIDRPEVQIGRASCRERVCQYV